MFTPIHNAPILRGILEQIKARIADNQLSKGDRLPSERAMAEMFGVSRAAIREAIKALEIIGLIDSVQGSGNFIATNMEGSLTEPLAIMFMLEHGSIAQIQQLRRAMETASVGIAARRISDSELQNLYKLCANMETRKNENIRSRYDRMFHYAIAAASGNPLISTMLNAASSLIEAQIVDVRAQMLKDSDNLAKINVQHRRVLEALEAHDPALATAAMDEHMDFIDSYLQLR